jgi:protein tyrosine/serine phosphatase
MPRVQATLYVLSLMEKVVSEQSENGIYLHCQRGEDRTGLMMALLRECTSTAWKSEFNEYGGVMYKPLQALMDEVSKIRSNR